jgi:hypothetical protein
MPTDAFTRDARAATATGLPVPRGIAFCPDPPAGRKATLALARKSADQAFPGWEVRPVADLPGWFEAAPPAPPGASPDPVPLGEAWERLRALRQTKGVAEAELLLLIASPQPATEEERDDFALGFGQERFGLWGLPYSRETAAEIERLSRSSRWHLDELRVPAAWATWQARRPGQAPGAGILVGHPDTGYTDHDEAKDCFLTPGRSFLTDEHGAEEPSALDTLTPGDLPFLEAPGHGTATASVIASGEPVGVAPGVFGVAPGARVLPLRVSRSVIHFDFGNVGRAIAHAVAAGADVISMSLGGPGYSALVRAAIARAHEQGVIVVSAAGNNLPVTVFPAAFPEVIAVAATHAARGPWRFTGIGRLVDIAAPGEAVWSARAEQGQGGNAYSVVQSSGTSFATACVAGLAALWLSHHGGRQAIADDHYGGRLALVPFAFQYLLARTADSAPDFVREGRYGAGVADAAALLAATLPDQAAVERFEAVIRAQPVHALTFVSGLFSGGLGVTDQTALVLTREATIADEGQVRADPVAATEAVRRAVAEKSAETALLARLLGPDVEALSDELLARIAADRLLLVGFQRWRQGESLLPFLARLLDRPADAAAAAEHALSAALRARLVERRAAEVERLGRLHRGTLAPGVTYAIPGAAEASPTSPPAPSYRRLRAYAFDPTLETTLDTESINVVTIPVRWEEVAPGPVGEYLEVVDIDPASGCVYPPVDLNHPHVLGQDGLAPSANNPQSHQQMVYAVAMTTINHFEMALGRPIFWSPLRPWLADRPEERYRSTPEARAHLGHERANPRKKAYSVAHWPADSDRYVQRLRVYPHALRDANAYYSPPKRALLFGYFPGADGDTGRHYPGGTVFTCLSHDIIAHETTHALLDGMHPYFNEPTNQDVWAFHEAFADIVALFQHFTYTEVLRHQIANTRGNLNSNNRLAQLAQEFGEATGSRGALRDALGEIKDGRWERKTPDPRALDAAGQPHKRGSILVAAVFDAYLALYRNRTADLLRLATGGTGILPEGQIHPDLVNRLASEAATTAAEVLRICIRAMDYMPPIDITFGEFLRALITADYDLAPVERRAYRIAFIDAFRSWGIYPRDVSSLSEEGLRWRGPEPGSPLTDLTRIGQGQAVFTDRYKEVLERLLPALERWQPGGARADVFHRILEAQRELHSLLASMQAQVPGGQPLLPGLDLRRGARFSVGNLRPSRRLGSRGQFLADMVVEVVQTYRPPRDAPRGALPFRGGATLIVDLKTWQVRYIIYKRLYARLPDEPGGAGLPTPRHNSQLRFGAEQRRGMAGAAQAIWQGEAATDLAASLAATYAGREDGDADERRSRQDEPFALLHRTAE